jgi:hypothetical protein
VSDQATPLFSAARWSELRALMETLADADAAVRAQEVARIAAHDAELAAILREMLADAAQTPTLENVLQRLLPITAEQVPARIGPFKLTQRIGAGGMGVVYLAEREHADFVQRVALKLLDGGSARVAQLASRERRVLAALAHPNITAFVDAGVQDGRAWLAMEYVDGAALLDYARQHALDMPARVRLFDQICAAVAHAHAQLVVHRDLKPANVLVNNAGTVKLLDFGIALVLDAREESAPATRVFTPEYAAPEQLRGERATTATDVYGLGLILYELVSGKRLSSVQRTAADAEWSTAELAQHAVARDGADGAHAHPEHDAKTLHRLLRGDLGRIISHALDPLPARRYASVTSLRENLARWLDFRPLTISRPSPLYVMRRFVRRHRMGVAVATAAFIAMLALGATALWQARAKTIEARHARAALRQSEATRDFVSSVFLSADPYAGKGTQTTAGELLAAARTRIDKDLAGEPDVAASLLNQIGNVYVSLGDDEAARLTLRDALAANARSAQPSSVIAASAKARLAHYDYLDGHREEGLRGLTEAATQLRQGGLDARMELAHVLAMQGNVLYAIGRMDESVAAETEGVGILRDLGAEHGSEYLNSLVGLADLLISLGRHAQALSLIEQGMAHPHLQTPEGALMISELQGVRGRALSGLERYAEAEPLLASVIAAETAKLGREHGRSRYWRYRHAQVLLELGRLDEARSEIADLQQTQSAGADNPVAQTARLLMLAQIDTERRDPAAALRTREAIAAGCGEAGNPSFCAKAKLLDAEVAIREHRFAQAAAELDSLRSESTVAANPALMRRVDLLRMRMSRSDGRLDEARALLAVLEKQTDLPRVDAAQCDIERGYLAIAAGERDAGIAALSRARASLAKPMTALTPQVLEIDAVVNTTPAHP